MLLPVAGLMQSKVAPEIGGLVLAVDEGLRARREGLRQFAPVDDFLFPVHGLLLKASVGSRR